MVTGDACNQRRDADGLGARDVRRAGHAGRHAALRRAGALSAALLVASIAGLGCGGTGATGAQVASQVKAAKEEQRPEKLMERGLAFAAVSDHTRAEQYLSAALEAGAPPEKVLPPLLRACVAENRFRAALSYAEPHLTKHPDDSRLRFVVASLHASVGDFPAALAHLERVAKTRPDYAEVHYAIAVLLRDDIGDAARADTHFREYLRLEPEGAHAAEARGSLLRVVAPTSLPAGPAGQGDAGAGGGSGPAQAPGPVRIPAPSPPSPGGDAGSSRGAAGRGGRGPESMNPVQAAGARDTLASPPP